LGRQCLAQGRLEGAIDGRKVDDGRRHNPPAGHNIGAENGQIEVGVWEKDAVENLQPRPQPGGFKMQLAQALAVMQFIAYVQPFAIETAADRFQLGIDRQRGQTWQSFPTGADPLSQGIHQGMDPGGGIWGKGRSGPIERMGLRGHGPVGQARTLGRGQRDAQPRRMAILPRIHE
jgi:hypothetical protein